MVEIRDEPRIGYRALLLDVGRHFFGPEEVKSVIDLMAMHKLNRLQWHLTEDQGWRIEIRKYPELTRRGAWRDRSDLRPAEDGRPREGPAALTEGITPGNRCAKSFVTRPTGLSRSCPKSKCPDMRWPRWRPILGSAVSAKATRSPRCGA